MTTNTQKPLSCDVQIRWIIRRDMPEVLEIETLSFPSPWTEEDYINCLKQRNCIGMVAKRADRVVGVMVYELLKDTLHVLNFAVHPEYRRQGVGSQMTDKLASKLSQQRRTKCVLEVRETNLAAQLFFSRQGYLAGSVLRGHYEEEPEEDAYQFTYYA